MVGGVAAYTIAISSKWGVLLKRQNDPQNLVHEVVMQSLANRLSSSGPFLLTGCDKRQARHHRCKRQPDPDRVFIAENDDAPDNT